MDLEELRKLCAILREEGLTELTVEEGGQRITLRRAAVAAPGPAAAPPEAGVLIRSPVVGTFWSRPAPDQPPFVKVGDRVVPGQVVCVVEAMKVMNEVRAEVSGAVEEVLAEDGSPVEYGQPLFRLRVG
ncbi:acetyl-CoA carboxylase, biotin carboxyl carrier protein [Candidatus Bipolaricaulota bacterium]|nr:acetyl-CoA carboxylase, biotin carboxyl carrier protein [Candidatus Bipolaricaulota bacterium]